MVGIVMKKTPCRKFHHYANMYMVYMRYVSCLDLLWSTEERGAGLHVLWIAG